MLIAIPPEQIVLFKSIVESYDNLATLRTEDPARHHLRIYFSADSRDEVEAMMTSLSHQFENREARGGVELSGRESGRCLFRPRLRLIDYDGAQSV